MRTPQLFKAAPPLCDERLSHLPGVGGALRELWEVWGRAAWESGASQAPHLWRAPRVAASGSAAPVLAAAPAHRRGRRQPARAAWCHRARRAHLPRPARLASVLGAEGLPPGLRGQMRQAIGWAPATDQVLARCHRPRRGRARCRSPPVSALARGGTRLRISRRPLRHLGTRLESAHLQHLPETRRGSGHGRVGRWRRGEACGQRLHVLSPL